jgi:hypothetical protein
VQISRWMLDLVAATCFEAARWSGTRQMQELGPFHVPIVPTSVKAPVAESMLYMETSFEAEFVT